MIVRGYIMSNDGNIFGAGNIDRIINLINTSVGTRADIAAIPSDTTSVIAIIKKIYNTAISILTSLLVLTETGATITTTGAEQDVYVNNAPAGVFSPRLLRLDFTNQTVAETIRIKKYYRIKSGGAYVLADEADFIGVQAVPLIKVGLGDNRYGVKVTMEKTVGANKDYDYEVTYKI